jgi:hypothetical protein
MNLQASAWPAINPQMTAWGQNAHTPQQAMNMQMGENMPMCTMQNGTTSLPSVYLNNGAGYSVAGPVNAACGSIPASSAMHLSTAEPQTMAATIAAASPTAQVAQSVIREAETATNPEGAEVYSTVANLVAPQASDVDDSHSVRHESNDDAKHTADEAQSAAINTCATEQSVPLLAVEEAAERADTVPRNEPELELGKLVEDELPKKGWADATSSPSASSSNEETFAAPCRSSEHEAETFEPDEGEHPPKIRAEDAGKTSSPGGDASDEEIVTASDRKESAPETRDQAEGDRPKKGWVIEKSSQKDQGTSDGQTTTAADRTADEEAPPLPEQEWPSLIALSSKAKKGKKR